MSLNDLPTRPSSSLDNPDYVHLKSLSDMCKQITLWATAADAQIQILLAKRAPVMRERERERPGYLPTPPIQGNYLGEISTTTLKSPPLPTNKADLHKMALSFGIPDTILDSREYLNAKARPSVEGVKRTQDLINKVLDKIANGEDPSALWTGISSEQP